MTRKTKHHPFFQAGFGIIETIVAVAIFSIIAATGTIAVLHSLSANRLGDEESQANFFATEGIEATRSIRNQGWDDPFLVTDCSSGCGLDSASGSWSWSGSETVQDKFTRVVEVAQAQRDGSDVIVESGGTLDPDTYKVTSTVTWNFSPTRNNTLALTTYIVNWSKLIQSFDFIYAFGGDNTNEFWRYDISGNSWSSMSTAPSNVAGGGALTYDGSDFIYAFGGDNTNEFWRYDIFGNSWSSMSTAPSNVAGGGALVYDGSSYLYALRGNNKNDFWRYDISANSWSSMTQVASNVKDGGALVYDGSSYLYAFRGNNKKDFWRYDISGNSWSSMTQVASNVKDGGALVYDGSSYIYAFGGNNTNEFWRYDISGNSWSSMAIAPSNVAWGGALTHDGSSYIYAFGGNNTNEFWRYDISGNSWSSMATALGNVAEGGALVIGKGVEINTPTPTVGPTATPGSTPVPTATSAPVPTSCTQVCAQAGYSVGSCRKDSKKCSSQGEVNVAAGDQFCTGGKNADTCCCQ